MERNKYFRPCWMCVLIIMCPFYSYCACSSLQVNDQSSDVVNDMSVFFNHPTVPAHSSQFLSGRVGLACGEF